MILPQSILDVTDLGLWRRRFLRVNQVFKFACGGYVILLLALLAVLLVVGFAVKEDVSVTIENFSISTVEGEEATDYPLLFEGVVPVELGDVVPEESIRLIKLYVVPSEAGRIGRRKLTALVEHPRISRATESVTFRSSETTIRDRHPLVPMKMGIFEARMSRMTSDGIDIVAATDAMGRRGVSDGIEKAKIVLGQTTILEFWIKKMFSRSPLYKQMSRFVD